MEPFNQTLVLYVAFYNIIMSLHHTVIFLYISLMLLCTDLSADFQMHKHTRVVKVSFLYSTNAKLSVRLNKKQIQ